MASRVPTVIAVEGISDKRVLERIAERSARAVAAEIVPIGGAHAIRRFVSDLGSDVHVRGLCDENEAYLFERVLDDVFVCRPDLESELIRALGVERVLEIVDLDAFRKMQRQPAQRGRVVDLQLHRWLRSSSTRFYRYLDALVDALDLDHLPEPLERVLWS